ncbi:plastocyanin/azurin family copper-binding protein [Pseudomonas aeruginosa]|nr:plastocyanin/azurin family copper-binding protein [Pseudomonas aeruginosa]
MDDINYSQKTIDVKPGETVRFVLKNEGALMHEFNIGQAASQLEHQRKMASLFKDGTLTPTGMAGALSGMSVMAWETPTLQAIRKSSKPSMTTRTRFSSSPAQPKSSWTFPKAGSLSFACTLPGHYQAGMVGELCCVSPASVLPVGRELGSTDLTNLTAM